METDEDMHAVVAALAGQVEVLANQARTLLGDARFAAVAGRLCQIRKEARRGSDDKALLEHKLWLDDRLAELLGVVSRLP